MPPQCCGKSKKPEQPGTTPEQRTCLDEAWDLFCSTCPGCDGNQACIDYLYGLYEYDYWQCYASFALKKALRLASVADQELPQLARALTEHVKHRCPCQHRKARKRKRGSK